jgi:ribosomal protein L18E
LTVKAHKFSASAREKILAAGGSVEELDSHLALAGPAPLTGLVSD